MIPARAPTAATSSSRVDGLGDRPGTLSDSERTGVVMRLLVVFLIGLAIGAFCAAAVLNALSKRGAHHRASMVVLAYHVDALRSLDQDRECAGPAAIRHWSQIGFAAREIGHAFSREIDANGVFRRRNDQFMTLVERPLFDIDGCAALAPRLRELEQGCQSCHREFR